MNFYLYTLGCKVNQYESECIIQAWQSQGYIHVSAILDADILIINSCAVTDNAIKDVKKLISYLHSHTFIGELLITGCAVMLLQDIDMKGIPYTLIPQEEKESLLRYPERHRNPRKREDNETISEEEPFILTSSLRARATIKIHDGCSHRCTYCIIPYTRGASKSRSITNIFDEIRSLLHAGYRELILSGINLRQFGADFTFPIDFWDFIIRLEKEFADEWHGIARIRISSLEPCQLNEKALDTLAHTRLICPHLHISLQSASDAVLHRMARSHYSATMLYHALEALHTIWKPFALGVDIITGFPGETQEDFLLTQQCVEALPITYAHIFPFSERPFTKAPTMPNQIYPHIRKERAKTLRSLVKKKQHDFMTYLVTHGIPQHIVPEKNNIYVGISQYYVECRKATPFEHDTSIHTPITVHDNYIDVQ